MSEKVLYSTLILIEITCKQIFNKLLSNLRLELKVILCPIILRNHILSQLKSTQLTFIIYDFIFYIQT